MKLKRECKYCKKEFVATRRDSHFCGELCAKKWEYRNNPKTYKNDCENCGKAFEGTWRKAKYCSKSCMLEMRTKKAKKRDVKKTCPVCSKTWVVPYHLRNNNEYCGRSCSMTARWKGWEETGRKEEICNKISAENKRQFATGERIHPFLGKKHTEATKKKIRKFHIENQTFAGENNPMYGRGHTAVTREKISKTRAEKILNGEYASWFSKGIHYSTKLKREVHYRSSWEKQAYEMLDKDESVVEYTEEPCRIPYQIEAEEHKRHYIPDLLITYKGGAKKLVEIKPSALVSHEKNVVKFKAARNRCKKENWLFEVWTEDTINPKKEKKTRI